MFPQSPVVSYLLGHNVNQSVGTQIHVAKPPLLHAPHGAVSDSPNNNKNDDSNMTIIIAIVTIIIQLSIVVMLTMRAEPLAGERLENTAKGRRGRSPVLECGQTLYQDPAHQDPLSQISENITLLN